MNILKQLNTGTSMAKMITDLKKHYVQVFYQSGDDPFICGVVGNLPLDDIEKELFDDEFIEGVFNRGDGDYLFEVYQEHDETDFGVHSWWDYDLKAFRPTLTETQD
jgi:hypothetical protein